ncbi:hypothetical protein SNE40_006958 [Patella caerulea]|uniref:Uncharacterized protein n=1 Tax=Patella caerulea TaxID=87958 RepID=A0AAN8JXN2_PATCE
MKATISLLCLVLLHLGVASGIISKQRPLLSFDCLNQPGCQMVNGKQCCQSKGRQSSRGSIRTSLPGVCQAFGTLGSACLMYPKQLEDGTYPVCPCGIGYRCVASGVKDMTYGQMGTCESQCTDNSECNEGQCCRIGEVLKGRKKRSVYTGVCTSFGTLGSKCVNGTDPLTHNNVHTECPCASPLDCNVSDGYRTIPVDFAKCGI